MGFEAARELDLPYLVWLGAVGESGKLAEAMSHASEWESGRGYVYCDRFYLATLLFLQGLSGRMSTAERTRWREWLEAPTQHSRAFDAFDSPGDPWPAVVSKLREIGTAARHPRAFFRKVIVGAGALVEFSRELPVLL
jgi:hypothetical protein